MQKEKKMLMQGFEPINLVFDEYWYRPLMYSAVRE